MPGRMPFSICRAISAVSQAMPLDEDAKAWLAAHPDLRRCGNRRLRASAISV